VQTGAVKVESVSEEGINMVDGFYFPGEIFGLDGVGDQRYRNDAIALETTWVCEMQYEQLQALCVHLPVLLNNIFKIMGAQIRQVSDVMVHNRYLPADKRLLAFLEALSVGDLVKKSYDGSIHLPMSKADMACYLGLRPESLSRALSKLAKEGLIRNHAKKIELVHSNTSFDLAYK
jgi:CRP/FNR family transcriptional regulator